MRLADVRPTSASPTVGSRPVVTSCRRSRRGSAPRGRCRRSSATRSQPDQPVQQLAVGRLRRWRRSPSGTAFLSVGTAFVAQALGHRRHVARAVPRGRARSARKVAQRRVELVEQRRQLVRARPARAPGEHRQRQLAASRAPRACRARLGRARAARAGGNERVRARERGSAAASRRSSAGIDAASSRPARRERARGAVEPLDQVAPAAVAAWRARPRWCRPPR